MPGQRTLGTRVKLDWAIIVLFATALLVLFAYALLMPV